MTRQLAYIETIKSLSPIPEADKIEKAEVLGWELVVKKGDFKVGDLVIYCEIDSILPEFPCFEFLRSKKFRIKTIKLKGQISQGIAFPLSVINEVDPSFNISKLQVGDDVSEILKITKYDPEEISDIDLEPQEKKSWLSKRLSYYKWKLFGIKRVKSGDFPSDVPKTDQERVQKMWKLLEACEGQPVYISEKIEGCSSTFVYRHQGNWLAHLFGQAYQFQVCSRHRTVYNSRKGGTSNHHLVKLSEKYDVRNKLKQLDRNLAVQAEAIGPKIQGNIYRLPELELRVFAIFDIDKQKYVDYTELNALCKQLQLPMVPILGQGFLKNDIKYYVELSQGKSRVNLSKDREGIVINQMSNSFSFKSINPEYLLKQKDDEVSLL